MQMIEVLVFFQFPIGSLQFAVCSSQSAVAVCSWVSKLISNIHTPSIASPTTIGKTNNWKWLIIPNQYRGLNKPSQPPGNVHSRLGGHLSGNDTDLTKDSWQSTKARDNEIYWRQHINSKEVALWASYLHSEMTSACSQFHLTGQLLSFSRLEVKSDPNFPKFIYSLSTHLIKQYSVGVFSIGLCTF